MTWSGSGACWRPAPRCVARSKAATCTRWCCGAHRLRQDDLGVLLARYADAEFVAISAVLSGLPQVREVLAQAQQRFDGGRRTVLFVDEVHRFNKVQQDAFLPHIERGTILFVGATTENPSFELNSALLSRCRVHVLEALSVDDIVAALRHALEDAARGLQGLGLRIDDESLRSIAHAADGDVRRALTLLEIAAELTGEGGELGEHTLQQVLADRTRRFDKAATSSTTRSRRCTNACAAPIQMPRCIGWRGCWTAAATWLPRTPTDPDGGGRHRPGRPARAAVAMEAWDAYERLGSPEGELALAQLAVYLASTAKSNAAYKAWNWRAAMSKPMAPRTCRCISATHPPG